MKDGFTNAVAVIFRQSAIIASPRCHNKVDEILGFLLESVRWQWICWAFVVVVQ